MATPAGSLLRSMQLIDTVATPRQHGVLCDSCLNEGKQRNAVKFCQQCRQNMCRSCVTQHAKFMTTKHHNLISKLESEWKNLSLIIDTCQIHSGKLLDMYCATHDTVCCAICVAVDHRNCTDVVYIPEAAKDIDKSREYILLKNKLISLRHMFAFMKKTREKHIASISEAKEKIFQQIEEYREKLIQMIHDNEKQMKVEVEKFYKIEETAAENNTTVCDDLLVLIDSVTDKFEEATKENNMPKLFVQMKLAYRKYKQFSVAADTVLGRKTRRLNYESSTPLKKMLQEQGSLGQLKIRTSPEFAGRQFSAQLKSDDLVCDIRGAVVLPDGKFVLADHANKKLKLVNTSYNCRPLCSFNSGPVNMCKVTATEVVVCLPQEWKIANVNVESGEVQYKTANYVKAVASSGGNVYVLESTYTYDKEGGMSPGLRLNKISWSSKVPKEEIIWSINKTSVAPSYYPEPTDIIIGRNPNTVHVMDRNAGMFTVRRKGNKVIVTRFMDKDLYNPFGIDKDISGDLFVTGRGSNNLVQLSRDGDRLLVLLTETDGLKRPQAVSYDDENQRILVTMQNSNIVLIFSLGFDPQGHYWEKDIILGIPKLRVTGEAAMMQNAPT